MLDRLERQAARMMEIMDSHMRVVRVHDILTDEVFTETKSEPEPLPEDVSVEEKSATQQTHTGPLNVRLESR